MAGTDKNSFIAGLLADLCDRRDALDRERAAVYQAIAALTFGQPHSCSRLGARRDYRGTGDDIGSEVHRMLACGPSQRASVLALALHRPVDRVRLCLEELEERGVVIRDGRAWALAPHRHGSP